jgi:16S rRNA (cytosine1402-N4)-methyltransferase
MNQPEQPNHRRRPRYSGTHPKSFGEKYKEHNIIAHPQLAEHLRAKGKTPASTHVPIMVGEVIKSLSPKPGEVVADCTLGYGGHAMEFIKHIGPDGKLIGFDVDGAQLNQTKDRLSSQKTQMSFYHSNYAGIANVLKKENIAGYDIIFADIGVSSMQIDNPDRGMSYKHNGPIDMRMDERIKQTGADLLNTLSEEAISNALMEFADEPDHKEIAAKIIARRQESPIRETAELVEIIFRAKGINQKEWQKQQKNAKSGSANPAAKTFQAMRILVNDELGSLKELLRVAPYCLNPGGRIGIISFHSGEDRIVKKAFKSGLESGVYQAVAENAITPTQLEIASNTRSASAKFRWAVKTIEK